MKFNSILIFIINKMIQTGIYFELVIIKNTTNLDKINPRIGNNTRKNKIFDITRIVHSFVLEIELNCSIMWLLCFFSGKFL